VVALGVVCTALAFVAFFELIKELLVESAKLFEQAAAQHDAAAGLPVNFPLGVTLPPIVFGGKHRAPQLAEKAEVQGRRQIARRSFVFAVA